MLLVGFALLGFLALSNCQRNYHQSDLTRMFQPPDALRKLPMCGDFEYNPLTTFCCNEKLFHKTDEDGCCGTKTFNSLTHMCCGDALHERQGNSQCCGTAPYQVETYHCCDGVLHNKTNNAESCCGKEIYNWQKHKNLCCDGKVVPKPPGCKSTCCGQTTYDYTKNICCRGKVKPLHGLSRRLAQCCGEDYFNLKTEKCCDGQIVPTLQGVVASRCCGKILIDGYDRKKLCCNGKVHSKTSTTVTCCGEESYNTVTHICCNNTVIKRVSEYDMCCGVMLYNSKEKECCGNSIIYPLVPGKGCCGAFQYDIKTQDCCLGIPTQSANKCGQTACCGSVSFDIATHLCCGGNIFFKGENERCCGDAPCMRGTPSEKRRCGDKLYDPDAQNCCTDRVYEKDSNLKCCVDQTYNPSTSLCCQGKVKAKKGRRSFCCCDQVYDGASEVCCDKKVVAKLLNVDGPVSCCAGVQFSFQHTTCCNNQVIGAPGDSGCCGSNFIFDTPFNRARKVCCNGRLLTRSSYSRQWCCGQHLYETATQICCGERAYSKNQYDSCCRGKPYKEANQICCDGILHAKPEGDAACCGRVPYNRGEAVCCRTFSANASYRRRPMTVYRLHLKSEGRDVCCNNALYNSNNETCIDSRKVCPKPATVKN